MIKRYEIGSISHSPTIGKLESIFTILLFFSCTLYAQINEPFQNKNPQSNDDVDIHRQLLEMEDELRFRAFYSFENKTMDGALVENELKIQDSAYTLTDSGFVLKVSERAIHANMSFMDMNNDTLTNRYKQLLTIYGTYGEDNRQDYYNLTENQKALVGTVACLIRKSDLTLDGDYYRLKSRHLYEMNKDLCLTERFYNQPCAGFCTGFACSTRIIATAGHCISSNLSDFKIIFGYIMLDSVSFPKKFHKDEVYNVVRVVSREYQSEQRIDYALLEVDRDIPNNRICTLRDEDVQQDETLFIAGHPAGLPLKYADRATVINASPKNYFITNLDSFKGNSGSPVFDANGRVVGILIHGAVDFVYSYHEDCLRSNVCTGIYYPRCHGESVSRISQFIHHLTTK